MAPILGIIASGQIASNLTSFDSIATVTVGAGGATDITFSSIPSTYTHLQIRGIVRNSSTASNYGNLQIQFNSDTGSNYAGHYLVGNGASAAAYAWTSDTTIESSFFTRDSAIANNFAGQIIDILDYKNTNKYKTVRILAGFDNNATGSTDYNKGILGLSSGLWQNTNAITTIKLFAAANSFMQYSSFALYGIKA